MAVPSPRIGERVASDLGGAAPHLLSALERLDVAPLADPERVHAAILIVARGNRTMFEDAVEHARTDWRDLLDRAGLARADWPSVVDAEWGMTSAP